MSMRGVFRSRAYFNTEHKRPNWWLRFASYRADSENEPLMLAELERIRRSKLTAWSLLGTFFALMLFTGAAANDIYSAVAVALSVFACIIGVLFNRKGHVNTAGIILVGAIFIGLTFPVIELALTIGGISVDMLPDFDFLAAIVFLAATTLPPRSTFIALAIISVWMLLTWNFLPHGPDLIKDQATYPSQIIAAATLIGRPLGFSILCAFLGFYVVKGYNEATIRMYVAMSVAEDRTDLATAMSRTAEEQTMIQHYQDIFFTAITQHIARRSQGIIESIRLNFPRPRSGLEEQTRIRVAAEAQRLNYFIRRLDTQEEQRMWNLRQYISTIRHYCHTLSSVLQDPDNADIGALHPKRFGTTNDPTLDSLISLVFAVVVAAEPWHLLTRSRLSFANVSIFATQTRTQALNQYQQAKFTSDQAMAPLPQAKVSSPLQSNQRQPSPQSYPSDIPRNPMAPQLEEQLPGRYDPASDLVPPRQMNESDYPARPGRQRGASQNDEPAWGRSGRTPENDGGWPSLDQADANGADGPNFNWSSNPDSYLS